MKGFLGGHIYKRLTWKEAVFIAVIWVTGIVIARILKQDDFTPAVAFVMSLVLIPASLIFIAVCDKRKKKAPHKDKENAWVCPHCCAVNESDSVICFTCGNQRY